MDVTSKFLYILRVCIQPGHREEEKINELIKFCQQSLIDDVMFFIDCEELNGGHITNQELIPWLNLITKAKKRLDVLGITTSINPWITLNHADRGRKLKQGQNFQLMVDPYGNQSTACACPLDEEWQDYITGIYALYCSIDPYMLWIEDDFRFHNHSPLEWGGCFCENHMKLYSQKAGKPLAREEFINGMLKTGDPNDYRKIWLDTARETLVDLAQKIGQSVHKVSPHVRLGLMSSIPDVHCAEGRDWEGILKGLAQDTPMVNRPHLPSYQEVSPQSYFWNFNTISRLSKANVPVDTEIYPELENSPRTLFAKSRAFSKFQIELSTILGAHGITMNLFNVMGNGVAMEDGFQNMLKDSKPFLNQLAALEISKKTPTGVKVLFDPNSSYTIHTSKGEKMEELYPSENFWAGLLSSYGIANCYSTKKQHQGEIIAVSGQYFRNLTYDQIKFLLENNYVLLDGKAVETIFDLGYGELLGIKNIKWYPQYSGDYAYEEVCNGKTYYGMDEARISLQRADGGFYKIEYEHTPYIITQAKLPNNEVIGPSMVVVNERIMILPSQGQDSFFNIHLDSFKQAIVKWVIEELFDKSNVAYTNNAPYLGIYTYKGNDELLVIVANASGDDLENISIHLPKLSKNSISEVNIISKDTLGTTDLDWSKKDKPVVSTSLKRFEIQAFVLKYN